MRIFFALNNRKGFISISNSPNDRVREAIPTDESHLRDVAAYRVAKALRTRFYYFRKQRQL